MAASRDGDFILISARKGSFLVLNSFNTPALPLNLLAVCSGRVAQYDCVGWLWYCNSRTNL